MTITVEISNLVDEILEKHYVSSKWGFCIEDPLPKLSDERFDIWRELCDNMVTLLSENKYRDTIGRVS